MKEREKAESEGERKERRERGKERRQKFILRKIHKQWMGWMQGKSPR